MLNRDAVDPALIGLKAHQFQLLEDVVLNHDAVIHAWVFGSRAIGTHKDTSDIDIAIEGEKLSLSEVAWMQERLEMSSLPFVVDLVIKHKIASTDLLAHIETHGVKIK